MAHGSRHYTGFNLQCIGNKSDKVVDKGQEEIALAGKKYKCHRYILTLSDNDGKEMMVFRYWFHPDIPGAAKIVSESSYGAEQGMGKTKATQSAVSWVKK